MSVPKSGSSIKHKPAKDPSGSVLPGLAEELSSSEVKVLPMADITVKGRLRELDEEKLRDLMYTIEKDDLLQPLVVAHYEGEYLLIAGHHRFEVCKRLNRSMVPVRLMQNIQSKDHLRRLEISENLFRNELSLLERAVYLAEYLKSDSALSALSAEEIADKVNISRRTFFYYKQVASMNEQNPDVIEKILHLPQDIKNSRSQLLDIYNLPTEERKELISTLEGNPATTYQAAKKAVTRLAVEAGSHESPLTITQVTRKRVQELKEVHQHFRMVGEDITMTDLVDRCLELGLVYLKQHDFNVRIPPVGAET